MSELIDQALADVEDAIAGHRRGDPAAPFSAKFLTSVRADLEEMAASPEYQPTYPRFVLDWPDKSGPLGILLMKVSDWRYRSMKVR